MNTLQSYMIKTPEILFCYRKALSGVFDIFTIGFFQPLFINSIT